MRSETVEKPYSIGERIRSTRKSLNLNQANLALRVGVSQPAIANWESGIHDPRRLMMAKLAEALGVSAEWLAEGARSEVERDKQPAAAYLRRPVQHVPVIGLHDAARLLSDVDADPHATAEDYISVTFGSSKLFAIFVTDNAVDLVFPKNTLVVIDYGDRRPLDGGYCLAAVGAIPILRRWKESPSRLEPCSSDPDHETVYMRDAALIIGCARVSIRVH